MTRFGSPMAMTVAEEGSEAETQQVRPKRLLWMLGEPPVALRGFSQFAWLRTLKNSARNCSLKRSVMAKSFNRPESKFRSEEHTSELQSLTNLVCRLLLEKKKK